MISHSPFKHLRSYYQTDRDYRLFFGRDKEIESVKRQLSKTKFLIVYGPSGSGKTSLLNAGILYPQGTKEKATLKLRFNSTTTRDFEEIFTQIADEWSPGISENLKALLDAKASIIKLESEQMEIKQFYLLDRKNNPFDSVKFDQIGEELELLYSKSSELSKALHGEFINLYQELNQVPVLILDQFEELFIFHGNSDGFLDRIGLMLDVLLSNSISVKIFLFIRSDYFGHLVHLEKYFPKVFFPKVLVDVPSRETLKIITTSLFKEFKITTEESEYSVIDNILDKVCIERNEDSFDQSNLFYLPYLQLYLDALYKNVFKKKYKGEEFDNSELKEVTITNRDVDKLGSINRVLLDFIARVNSDILKKMKKYENEAVKKRIQEVKLPATLLLKRLVSSKNTKKRIYFYESKFTSQDMEYLLGGFLFENISYEDQQIILRKMLNELEINGLINYNKQENYLELIHDSLAEFISTIIVDKDEQVLLAQKFMADYELHNSYEEDDIDFYLDKELQKKIGDKIALEKNLKSIGIELLEEHTAFWDDSLWYNKAKKRRATRIRNAFLAVITISLLIALGFLLNSKVANANTDSAKEGFKFEENKRKKEGKIFQNIGKAFDLGKTDIKSAYDSLNIKDKEYLDLVRSFDTTPVKFWEVLKQPSLLWSNNIKSIEDLTEDERKHFKDKLDSLLKKESRFAIRRQYFEDLENNLYKRPFYLNSIHLGEHDEMVLSTKTRKLNGSEDTLIIYAQTLDYLQQHTYDLKNDEVYHNEKLLGKISSFEPFERDGRSQVLVSSQNALILLDDSLKAIDTPCEIGHDFIIMEKIEKDKFICLKDDRKSLFIYDSKTNRLSPYYFSSSLGFGIRDIFKISYLKKTKETILGLKSATSQDWIIKRNDQSEVGGVSFQNLISIKNIKVLKNGDIYLADASSVYKINSSDIGNVLEIKQTDQPIIIHDDDENGEIKTIDIEGNHFIIGTQGNIAQTYVNEGHSYQTAIKKQKLIGHSDALINVSYIRDGNFALTSGQGGSFKVWNLRVKSTNDTFIRNVNNGISNMKYRDSSLFVGFRLIDNISENGPGFIAEYDDSLDLIEKHYYRGLTKLKEVEMPYFDFEKNGNIAAGTFWGQEIRNAQIAGSKAKSIKPNILSVVRNVRIVDSLMVVATNDGIKVFVKRNDKYIEQELDEKLKIDAKVNAVDFDKTSNKVIGAGEDGKVYVWDLDSSRLQTLHSHHDKITDVSFSQDGKFFVSCSWDNRAIVWKNTEDPNSSDKYIIKVHNNDVEDVAISSDNIIATASSDNTVQLHAVVNSGENLEVNRLPSLINHDFSIRSVAFGNKSNILFSGDKKGVIKRWDRNNFLDN